MKKILLFVMFLFCFSVVLDAKEINSESYSSNKISVDESLRHLKKQEDSQKKQIDKLNNEINTLTKRLAIFGEKTEDEHEKIKKERAKLNQNIQNKRAKMLDVMLELNKTSEDIAYLNASIFEQYVENMKRIDDFVFSKKYIVESVEGLTRLSAQLKEVFTERTDRPFSFAVFLKILVGIFSISFLFKIVMDAREKLDKETAPNLRFWIKNLNYLLFPFGFYACSYLLFSFNFVVNEVLSAICVASVWCVFLRKQITDTKILASLSIIMGFHIIFEKLSGDFDMKFELVAILSALFVITESFLGFLLFKNHRILKWIFVIPMFLIMSGYVSFANSVLYRVLIISAYVIITRTFYLSVKELLVLLKTFISKHVDYKKVCIFVESIAFFMCMYVYFTLFLFACGFRESQIYAINRKLLFDMKFKDINLSLSHIGLSLLVFVLIISLSSFVNKKIEKGKFDESIKYSVSVGFKYIGFIVAILVFLSMLGVTFTSISIIVGALSVGIGFGLQNIVNNFVSGIIILFERPIKVGDWVALSSGQQGNVMSISIRTTTIETFQKAHIIVPNADILSSSFLNWNRKQPFTRIDIAISVAINSDPEFVKQAMLEVAKDNHKVLEIPASEVRLTSWQDDGMIMELRSYIKEAGDRGIVSSDLRYAIVKKFREYGIDRPIPRRTIINVENNKESVNGKN